MRKTRELTQHRLKQLFSYNENTGIFTRSTNRGRPAGEAAGSVTHNGYIRIMVDRKGYTAHALAFLYMTGSLPDESMDIDHINQDRSDNRWSNLRLVTRQGNMRNAKRSAANTSGFTGVTWDAQTGKWLAQICISGKSKKLGRHDSLIDAVAARMRANKLYGFHANHGAS